MSGGPRGERQPASAAAEGRHAQPWTEWLQPLLLTAVAGYVDAVGYLVLSGLFVSFMSGNSTQFAAALAVGETATALATIALIGVFALGVAVGTVVVELAGRSAAVAILALETLLLAVTAILASDGIAVPHLLPLAFAMGLQNNLRRSLAGTQIGSTFVTGALVSLAQGAARHLLGRVGAVAWVPHALAWTALVLGALLGAGLYLGRGLSETLVLPALVTGLAAVAQARRVVMR